MHRVVTFSLLAPLAPFSPFSVSSAFLFSGAAAPFSACPFSAMASKSALQLPVRVEELLPSLYIVVYIAQLSLVTLHRVVLHCCYEWNKWRGKIHENTQHMLYFWKAVGFKDVTFPRVDPILEPIPENQVHKSVVASPTITHFSGC